MQGWPGWRPAIAKLAARNAAKGAAAARSAASYGRVYAGERAAMVVDVVASARLDYEKRVLPAVAEFKANWPGLSISALAAGGWTGLGLSARRWKTIESVAAALDRYRTNNPRLAHYPDDDLARDWADSVEPIRLAPRLDRYCGSVNGIGVALSAYLRMRAGVDAIKPDFRVRKSLEQLGFLAPMDPVALTLLAEAAAEDIGVTRLHLDQLLW